MKDKFGRTIDYIRISLTDKCNLRCVYCMPERGNLFFREKDNLTNEEIIEIVKASSELGIKKVRLTGGEPLIRGEIDRLISDIYKIEGIEEIAITTNGILLEDKLENMKKNGVKNLNISLDTLDRDKFKSITRVGDIDKVFRAIDKALDLGINIKINTVIIKGINDDEIIPLVKFIKDKKIKLRFIELMPIGEGKNYKGLSKDEILEIIDREGLERVSLNRNKSDGPANYIQIEGFKGQIGFISAMSDCFCEDCNRIRITTDGMLKKCLNWKSDINLKETLRGENREELIEVIREGIYNKPEKYLFNEEDANEENRNMNKIGG